MTQLSAQSMAAEIVSAMNALVPPRPNEDDSVRLKLAFGIAFGVVKHLSEVSGAGGAISADVTDGGGDTYTGPVTIQPDLTWLP